ncbi:uncharacterized protein I303_106531 [Kwoniella dejecticola CBS 10117]|uniref:B-related factor 1 n=1 Tax=Kwoniella dejecticola CBS 10117 TaxID=1296121 RepID=A0A1A5ZUF8_9TREE|nr:uncharacterized protein I303_08211 [Kwoniella dejecticola CBS 10117]OBR81441.1 hypothetical protein I303_08211 [Kwoniella dejecticola CBS 10117]
MSSTKVCPNCRVAGETLTDLAAGNVVCQNCGVIVESGILVQEVGFAEGSGGRVHVQGSFVARNQTGFAGHRSSGKGIQNTDGIKQNGSIKIDNVARQMHINSMLTGKAKRFFSMAVDNRFNKGRRTEYIVASCLYLACRIGKDAHMLIDFSERLSINVYELGATYLKLRGILHLPEQMPEVDPAIYNLRFAHKLDFGPTVNMVATNASRLVRRFRADWMTQGRRPAGVCGACLIIAARMSNFLRTPDEVAQVVKVHPTTIKKRLLEFAQTEMAKKTIAEWRNLTTEELDRPNEVERPPIVKWHEKQQIKVERLRSQQLAASEAEAGSQNEDENEAGAEGEGRSQGGYQGLDDEEDEDVIERIRKRLKPIGDDDMAGSIAAAAHDIENDPVEEEEEEEDDDLAPINQAEYVRELESARDNPEASKAERLREKSALMRQVKNLQKTGNEDDQLFLDRSDDEDSELEQLAQYNGEDKEEGSEGEGEPLTQLQAISKEEQDAAAGPSMKMKVEFKEWEDQDAVLDYLAKEHFKGEELLYQGKNMSDRIKKWIGERDPKIMIEELAIVQKARLDRERLAKFKESQFDDLDDEELEQSYRLDEDEKQARARMWLSSNGKWLEEEKIRIEQKAAAMRAKGLDPSKPKPKRKRAAPHKGPYNTPREAIQNFAKGKQFSSRVNYDILRSLEGGNTHGLVPMEDEKDEDYAEDEGWDQNEKEDEY